MALETRIIKQPSPVDPSDPLIFRFCPSCGEELLEPNTHLMTLPTISGEVQIAIHGWECTSCKRFFTGTHLGISWCDLSQYPTVKERRTL